MLIQRKLGTLKGLVQKYENVILVMLDPNLVDRLTRMLQRLTVREKAESLSLVYGTSVNKLDSSQTSQLIVVNFQE